MVFDVVTYCLSWLHSDDDGNFEYPEGMPQLQGLGMDTYDSDDDAQFVM